MDPNDTPPSAATPFNQRPALVATPFVPEALARSVIALPLLAQLEAEEKSRRWLENLQALAARQEVSPRNWVKWLLTLVDRHRGSQPNLQVLRLLRQAQLFPFPEEQADWLVWFTQWLANPVAEHPPLRLFPVIIDLNLKYKGGRSAARERVFRLIEEVGETARAGHRLAQTVREDPKNEFVQQYVFARLSGTAVRQLVARDVSSDAPTRRWVKAAKAATDSLPLEPRAIYRIWPDFPIGATVNKSIATVKADAAQVSYAALGEGMVWAVMDSGIEKGHPHFALHKNLEVAAPLAHKDYSGSATGALADAFGHGTHVAGIIAGEQRTAEPTIRAYTLERDERNNSHYEPVDMAHISGLAPKCKLLSLKVLDDQGKGEASSLIAAIGLIQELNSHGRNLLVQGVNMSVGYEFKPEWFACGQSPLCVEVNRLVRSGVVVVVAAGNTGYGVAQSYEGKIISAGMAQTINDPGNADLAITVGSTHRDMPHVYGVSYFSSKGPTGDGRLKPDLVAPGEKIISCAAGAQQQNVESVTGPGTCSYLEQSGTSMAAPHVSGAVAAFLSIRREFVGYPEKVKDLFLASATDLKRERYFQGAGLVDLMRAIQSV